MSLGELTWRIFCGLVVTCCVFSIYMLWEAGSTIKLLLFSAIGSAAFLEMVGA